LFNERQYEGFASPEDLSVGEVNADSVNAQRFCAALGGSIMILDNGAHASKQFTGRKGLGDVVSRSHGERRRLVAITRKR